MAASDPTSNAFRHEVLPTQVGYDRWAEVYDGEDNPLILLEEEQLAKFADDLTGLVVADIGCGTGRHALRLSAAGARVTAVDFSKKMLARARAKPGAEAVTFLQHDLASPLPFPQATFDRIFCCLVAEHIADLNSLFHEFRRLTKPGGMAIITAMHPAMGLRGVEPRFIDPQSGGRYSPQSHPHQICDYVIAALRTRWSIDHLGEYAVDAALAARSPRGQKYQGWPLLLLMRLRADQSILLD
jgi:malonyl-CoA O-methyltransferase